MNSNRSTWREFGLMTLPCVMLGLAGSYFANRPTPAPPPLPPMPTPAPIKFWIEMKRFRIEPVNTENKKLGADTCMTTQTLTHNEPPNIQWFYCRRLVATKNGKTSVLWHETSVLWHDMMPMKRSNLDVARYTSFGGSFRTDNLLFKLRDVSTDRGELIFVWDALAQPVNRTIILGSEKYVSLKELERAAKWGGLRLSKRLVLRKANKK